MFYFGFVTYNYLQLLIYIVFLYNSYDNIFLKIMSIIMRAWVSECRTTHADMPDSGQNI